MAARDRKAFRGATHTAVRCPRCGVRLAELRPVTNAVHPGWDGPVFADTLRDDAWPHDPVGFRCRYCKAPLPVDDRELHDLLAAARRVGRRYVTLGDAAP